MNLASGEQVEDGNQDQIKDMPFFVLKSNILSSFLSLATWTFLFRYYVSGLQCQNIQHAMLDLTIV